MIRIKIIYWIGIIGEAIGAVNSFYRQFIKQSIIASDFFDYKYTSVTLIITWTVILYWGSRKPIERKAVLLFTVIPILLGLSSTVIFGWITGIIDNSMIKKAALNLIFIPIFLYGYLSATKFERKFNGNT